MVIKFYDRRYIAKQNTYRITLYTTNGLKLEQLLISKTTGQLFWKVLS